MIQLTINTEAQNKKEILETLQEIIKQIQAGKDGDYDASVSWWLEGESEDI